MLTITKSNTSKQLISSSRSSLYPLEKDNWVDFGDNSKCFHSFIFFNGSCTTGRLREARRLTDDGESERKGVDEPVAAYDFN